MGQIPGSSRWSAFYPADRLTIPWCSSHAVAGLNDSIRLARDGIPEEALARKEEERGRLIDLMGVPTTYSMMMPKISLFLDIAARALSSSPLPCRSNARQHASKRLVGGGVGRRGGQARGTGLRGVEKRKNDGVVNILICCADVKSISSLSLFVFFFWKFSDDA